MKELYRLLFRHFLIVIVTFISSRQFSHWSQVAGRKFVQGLPKDVHIIRKINVERVQQSLKEYFKSKGVPLKEAFAGIIPEIEEALFMHWAQAKDRVKAYRQDAIDKVVIEKEKGYAEWIEKQRDTEFPFRDRFKEQYADQPIQEYAQEYREDERIHKFMVKEIQMQRNRTVDRWTMPWPDKKVPDLMNEPYKLQEKLGDDLWKASQKRGELWYRFRYDVNPHENHTKEQSFTLRQKHIEKLRKHTTLLDLKKIRELPLIHWQAAIYLRMFDQVKEDIEKEVPVDFEF